jgi:hypothetical protein
MKIFEAMIDVSKTQRSTSESRDLLKQEYQLIGVVEDTLAKFQPIRSLFHSHGVLTDIR